MTDPRSIVAIGTGIALYLLVDRPRAWLEAVLTPTDWWIVHHLVAHPLIVLWPTIGLELHEYTARRLPDEHPEAISADLADLVVELAIAVLVVTHLLQWAALGLLFALR